MRPVATDVARSVVCVPVGLYVLVSVLQYFIYILKIYYVEFIAACSVIGLRCAIGYTFNLTIDRFKCDSTCFVIIIYYLFHF